MKIGDIVRYNERYIGQLFVVVGIDNNVRSFPIIRCMRIHDGFMTMWSNVKTLEKVNESR